MKYTKDKILKTIEYIEKIAYNQTYEKGHGLVNKDGFPDNPEVVSRIKVDLVVNLTLNLIEKIYGNDNDIFFNFQTQLTNYNSSDSSKLHYSDVLEICLAKLELIRSHIDLDLLNTIYSDIASEIVTDFTELSKSLLEQENLKVGSVLACAALEDSLKRYAIINGLNVEDKSMSEVTNSLKTKSLLSKAQGNILKGFTTTRNKCFHAEWEKITVIEIKSIIAFTEQFIIDNFK
ncbi:MAG: hypothetical protein ABGW88_02130 [Leeuwenhoekiella sp.]|uniref:hypothetical protein n=1 Tax=Leeuwenhoekiella sp. TaxID=1977054 RepID=UPI0032422E21|tara:strand:+ start:515 stop:1213 length:699 start_codon:yes stop_codon:yes gene_type:complete